MRYTYTVTKPAGAKAVTFEASTRTFTFGVSEDIRLAGDDAIDYTITITGTTGGLNSAAPGLVANTMVRSFVLTIFNPCLDPDSIWIAAPRSNPSFQEYKLFTYSPTDPFWITEH